MAASPVSDQRRGRSDLTLYGLLRRQFEDRPEDAMIVSGGRVWTYAEVHTLVESDAARLVSLGVGLGDRVVLWQGNGIRWVSTFFACARLGAVAVLANTRLRALDLSHILSDSGAVAVIFTPNASWFDLEPAAERLVDLDRSGHFPSLRHLVATGPTNVKDAKELDDLDIVSVPSADEDTRRAAVACYTSGSTGTPKGCLHSHRTLVRNGSEAASLLQLEPRDRVLCPVPFSHVFGFHMGVIQCVISGATLIDGEPYDATRLKSIADSEAATVLYAVPTMAREFAIECRRSGHAPSQLRVALIAGAPVGLELRNQFVEPPPLGLGIPISVVYGCTEAPTLTQLLPNEQPKEPGTAVGRPTPGIELRIVVPGGVEEVPSGSTGEIVVRGYNTMIGYLGDPAGTVARYRGSWFATEDLGWLDEDGVLHVVGRHSEMFLVGGFNAYPAEIAGQLEQMDGIAEVAVIGVPDERLGAVPLAWVVPSNVALQPDEVMEWAKDHLAGFKRPRHVQLVAKLPRTSSGKLARGHLERMSRSALPSLPWRAV